MTCVVVKGASCLELKKQSMLKRTACMLWTSAHHVVCCEQVSMLGVCPLEVISRGVCWQNLSQGSVPVLAAFVKPCRCACMLHHIMPCSVLASCITSSSSGLWTCFAHHKEASLFCCLTGQHHCACRCALQAASHPAGMIASVLQCHSSIGLCVTALLASV